MFALMDIWHTILNIVHSADTIQLATMAVVALGAGFMMMELGAVVTTTLVALIAYAVLTFIRAIVLQHADVGALLIAESLCAEAVAAGCTLGPSVGPLTFDPAGQITPFPAARTH
jgi:hypothetical protein